MSGQLSAERVTESIRAFLFDRYLFGYEENELDNDASFMDNGVLDSMGILELVTFVENTFGITVTDADILPENMDSVNRLEQFIRTKLKDAVYRG
ncbi:acyl carrier protein [Oscillospiraceae bacterium WX1]